MTFFTEQPDTPPPPPVGHDEARWEVRCHDCDWTARAHAREDARALAFQHGIGTGHTAGGYYIGEDEAR